MNCDETPPPPAEHVKKALKKKMGLGTLGTPQTQKRSVSSISCLALADRVALWSHGGLQIPAP